MILDMLPCLNASTIVKAVDSNDGVAWEGYLQLGEAFNIFCQITTCGLEYSLALQYQADKDLNTTIIQTTSVHSNLGFGRIRYLICPKTGVRCKKLHFDGTEFLHRSAIRGLYWTQTITKTKRERFREILGAVC